MLTVNYVCFFNFRCKKHPSSQPPEKKRRKHSSQDDENYEDYDPNDDPNYDSDYDPNVDSDYEPNDNTNSSNIEKPCTSARDKDRDYVENINDNSDEDDKIESDYDEEDEEEETKKIFSIGKSPNPIYITKISVNAAGKRVQARQACLYCKKIVAHIQPHLLSRHADEKQVRKGYGLDNQQEATTSNKHPKHKKVMQEIPLKDKIILQGNHTHNMAVLENGGEFILSRRPKDSFNHEEYGPCPNCLDWMKRTTISKHQKQCISRQGTSSDNASKQTKGELLVESDDISGRLHEVSKLMKDEVLSIMTPDEISEVARKDECIMYLGEHVLRSNIDNESKRMYYASQRMRDSSRMLSEVRKLSGNENMTMWEALRPAFFDDFVSGALNLALPHMDDEEELQSPSYGIKIKYDLERMAGFKRRIAAKAMDKPNESQATKMKMKEEKEQASEMQYNLRPPAGRSEWTIQVTRAAHKVLKDRQDTKVKNLPKPADLQRLSEENKKGLGGLDLRVTAATWERFSTAVKYAQSTLLTFNKRRSGEIESIK